MTPKFGSTLQEDAPVRHVVSAPARPRQTNARGSQMQKTLEMMQAQGTAGRKTFSLRTDMRKRQNKCEQNNANSGLIIPPPAQGQQGQQGLWDPASY